MAVIYKVFDQYSTSWSISNAFSLLICKIYTKRENAGSWISGPEKAIAEIAILHISKWAEISQRIILEYIKNTGPKIHWRRGARCPHSTWVRPPGARPDVVWRPWPTSGLLLLVYSSFYPKTIM